MIVTINLEYYPSCFFRMFLSCAFFLLYLLQYCFVLESNSSTAFTGSSNPHNQSGYSESSFKEGSAPPLEMFAPTHMSMFSSACWMGTDRFASTFFVFESPFFLPLTVIEESRIYRLMYHLLTLSGM